MNSPMGFNAMGPQMLREVGGCGSCGSGSGGAKKPRKLTPYNKFVKKEFAAFKKQYPSKSATEIMKLIGQKWRSQKK